MGKMGLPNTEGFPSAQGPQLGCVLPMSARYSPQGCSFGEVLRLVAIVGR